MSEDDKKPEPETEKKTDAEDPLADFKHGVGLLFRAAKTAAHGAAERAKDGAHAEKVERAFKTGVGDLQKTLDRLQSEKLEDALKTSLQEIGRAFGNVAQTLERELKNKD